MNRKNNKIIGTLLIVIPIILLLPSILSIPEWLTPDYMSSPIIQVSMSHETLERQIIFMIIGIPSVIIGVLLLLKKKLL